MIGLCCQYLEPKLKRNNCIDYINIVNEKSLQYNQFLKSKYSSQYILDIWLHNILSLHSILERIHSEGIKVFRISSNLLPLFDLNTELHYNQKIKQALFDVGKFANDNNIRLTTHPDQFVVLSSNREDVIANSIKILEYHAWIFDQMNLVSSPYNCINIHGGTKGNSETLINSISKLPINVRSRLTLENDERSYNVKDLLEINKQTNVPIVFDSHHHNFNDAQLTVDQALELCITTWGNIKPMTHLSNTAPELCNSSFVDRRKHSNYVHYIPDIQLKLNNSNTIDIEFEFKMKNLAIFKAIKDFDIKL